LGLGRGPSERQNGQENQCEADHLEALGHENAMPDSGGPVNHMGPLGFNIMHIIKN
jgi:hypothetical protein